MSLHATHGSTIFIGPRKPMPDEELTNADFTGVTWTQIREVEALGSIGDTTNLITGGISDRVRDYALKGSRAVGMTEIVCGLSPDDPGQQAVFAAEQTDQNYAFKIVLNDDAFGGAGSQRLFVALVAGVTEVYDAANNVMKLNISLARNSNVVRIAAVGGTD